VKIAFVLVLVGLTVGMGYAEFFAGDHLFGIDTLGVELIWTAVLGLVCVALLSKIEIRKRRECRESNIQ